MPKSKRRSAPKQGSSNLSRLEIFCDRSLGRLKVPQRLRQLHPHVIAHDEVFAQDTDDDVWLEAAGRNGWVVLTRDDKIRYTAGARNKILDGGVRCFLLHPTTDMTGEEMAEVLAAALPKILRIVESSPSRGFIKGINRHGRIRHLFP